MPDRFSALKEGQPEREDIESVYVWDQAANLIVCRRNRNFLDCSNIPQCICGTICIRYSLKIRQFQLKRLKICGFRYLFKTPNDRYFLVPSGTFSIISGNFESFLLSWIHCSVCYHTKFLYAAERRILRLDEIMFWRQKICGPVAAGGQRKILGQ